MDRKGKPCVWSGSQIDLETFPQAPVTALGFWGLRGQRPKPSGANEAHYLMKLCTIWTNLLERQVLCIREDMVDLDRA